MGMDTRELASWLQINRLEYCLRSKTLSALFGAFREDVDALLEAGVSAWERAVSLSPGERRLLSLHWPFSPPQLRKQIDWMEREGLALISFPSALYPQALRESVAPPLVLFAKGRVDLLSHPDFSFRLAVVGSRDVTSYGRRVALSLVERFSAPLVWVSGMARGVDQTVHSAALERALPTIGVLGCGIDRVYPVENRDLYRRMAVEGLILSEFPIGTPPHRAHFPRRNRIIAALCQGLIVIEARERSGSLVSAKWALENGRELFAVPGSIYSPQSAGTHRLLAEGAHVLTKAEDLIAVLPEIKRYLKESAPASRPPRGDIPHLDSALLCNLEKCFEGRREWQLDQLVETLGVSPQELALPLFHLEEKGCLRSESGEWYEWQL